jgi:hypothetical protein
VFACTVLYVKEIEYSSSESTVIPTPLEDERAVVRLNEIGKGKLGTGGLLMMLDVNSGFCCETRTTPSYSRISVFLHLPRLKEWQPHA